MNLQTLTKLALFFLLVSCTEAFYETEIMENQSTLLIANDWQKSNFWINQQSIVADMEVTFEGDNSFSMVFKALGKKNTTYEKFIYTGDWEISTDGKELSLIYNNSLGIIGYYLEEDITKEIYQLKANQGEILLINETENQVFDLVLTPF